MAIWFRFSENGPYTNVCIDFAIIENSFNTNKKNMSVGEYILKCLTKREAVSKKISLDQIW